MFWTSAQRQDSSRILFSQTLNFIVSHPNTTHTFAAMRSIISNTRRADVVFRKSGAIDISATVAKGLSLSQGDHLDVVEDKGEYYLCAKKQNVGRFEGRVYPSNKMGGHFRASSVRLTNAILAICGADTEARLCVGAQVELPYYGKAYPIITKLLL
jgi:hypothetical protein